MGATTGAVYLTVRAGRDDALLDDLVVDSGGDGGFFRQGPVGYDDLVAELADL